MALPRRWIFASTLAFLFLFILYELDSYWGLVTSGQRVSEPLANPTYSPQPKPSDKASDGKFKWTDHIVRYPVQSLTGLPSGNARTLPAVQHDFGAEAAADRDSRLQRQQKVKDVFSKCWQSYRTRAWMHDELSPISGYGRDFFGGWAATLVDALDTLYIMGMKDEFEEAVNAAINIDFSTSTDETVNIFETTIRYLGGFLAAYDLSGERRLLDKAIEVGEMLLVPFDTPNRMPITRWDWKAAAQGIPQVAHSGMLVSELGSLSLEFTRLSQLTGDLRWYDAIDRITTLFDDQQDLTKIPGLWPVVVNARDMNLTTDTGFTLGGMSDSLYEYFPKEYALLGGLAPVYKKLYENSMAAAFKHLFFRPMIPHNEDILISGNARASDDGLNIVLDPQGQHLGCFTGGMLALGGRLFSLPDHVAAARKLVDGCLWAYSAMPVGVMPETFHLVPCVSTIDCVWSTEKYSLAVLDRAGTQDDAAKLRNPDEIIVEKRLTPGFTDIGDRRYILRPEAIESVFVLYRVTGDTSLMDAAWRMFEAIDKLTATELANAAISDITATGTNGHPPKDDRMESFWMAETLKYFYLIYSEPSLMSLDEYVLNTEAHPFKRPR